ncbi:MAG: hypothetical protein WDA20_00970 [Desulfuromonadales bacterium]|jgi:hypothetical protein
MAEQERRDEMGSSVDDSSLERLDEDLDIMERHAERVAESEDEVKEAMRKWDREFKNERFHSVPKPRKHIR